MFIKPTPSFSTQRSYQIHYRQAYSNLYLMFDSAILFNWDYRKLQIKRWYCNFLYEPVVLITKKAYFNTWY